MLTDRKHRSGWWLDACAICSLMAALIFPLFRLNYLNNWYSIESTFIADARLLRENWLHHLWQPLWYLGTRADYVYPPGLRYGAAIVSWLLNSSPAQAYHICIALFYVFGIVAVYLWVRGATGSREAAWLAATGVALVSPWFLIASEWRGDSPFHVPMRLHVLMKYGEGPHISSLAVLPIAWLGAWRRFRGGGIRWLLLSAGGCATVVTVNFYGATALAITFPIVSWACFLERRDWRILRDSALIAALAYGLTAWWLAPSYFQITLRNLHLVARQGRTSSMGAFAAILIFYIGVTLASRRWVALAPYPFFVWSGFLFLSLYVLGSRWFGFQVAGEAQRLMPEWDLFAILCAVTLAAGLWRWRPAERFWLAPRVAVVLLLALCFRPSWRYLKHAYTEFPADRQWEGRLEYRTADWLWRNFPDQRVYVSGTIRFWCNVWHDEQQADGGSLQGILNLLVPTASYRVLHAAEPEFVLHWLEAQGVDIVVVPGPASAEPYKDFSNGWLFERYFPLLYDDGAGNRFYRVPRRAPGIVRIVDRGKVLAAPPIPTEYETAPVAVYAAAIEAVPPSGSAPSRARGHWRGSDELDIQASAQAGEALLVQETYDPYWRAYADGKPQSIRPDAAGLMLVDLPPGNHSVRMVFETPTEVSVGRTATCITVALMVFLGLGWKRGAR
jgi:hypothetical protein